MGNRFFFHTYVVDNIVYVVRVSITDICCGQRFLCCGCMLWTTPLWVTICCGYRLHVVGICCGQRLSIVYVVGVGMLWVTCLHNICLCSPQHIICCGCMLWSTSRFTDVMLTKSISRSLQGSRVPKHDLNYVNGPYWMNSGRMGGDPMILGDNVTSR